VVRKLTGYRELCDRYGVDPDAPWDQDGCGSVEATIAFLAEYDELRRRLAGWCGEMVAAWAEGVIAAAELAAADPRLPALVARHGEIVIVTDEWGGAWMLTASPAHPGLVAQAMARARKNDTPLS
jgi:hypothetical protein